MGFAQNMRASLQYNAGQRRKAGGYNKQTSPHLSKEGYGLIHLSVVQ